MRKHENNEETSYKKNQVFGGYILLLL